MAHWKEIEAAAPDFAVRVRRLFEAGTNKTLATLRKDGSPRISASEASFTDGELTLGMMPDSMKLRDVRRDPRVALHCPTLEPPPPERIAEWEGDAKVAGLLVAIDVPPDSPHTDAGFFRVDIHEVVLTYVNVEAELLVVESWHPELGWRKRERA